MQQHVLIEGRNILVCEWYNGTTRVACPEPPTFLFIGGPCPGCGFLDTPQPTCRAHTAESIERSETFCLNCNHVWTAEERETASEIYTRLRSI